MLHQRSQENISQALSLCSRVSDKKFDKFNVQLGEKMMAS